jgi:hypothetical protein
MSFMNLAFAPADLSAFDDFVASNLPAPDDIDEARFLVTSGIVPDSVLTRAAFVMAWAVLRHDFASRRSAPPRTPSHEGDAA